MLGANKVEITPKEKEKQQRKFAKLLKFLDSKKGRDFLAIQASDELKKLGYLVDKGMKNAENNEFWEYVRKTAEEVRKSPDWKKGARTNIRKSR